MLSFLMIFIIPFYLLALIRLLYYLYRGRELGGSWLALLVDAAVVVALPWLVLSNVGEDLEVQVLWGLVFTTTASYFYVSYRKLPLPPLPEFFLQWLLSLGIALCVGLGVGEPFMWIGILPVICLFVLVLEKGHRSVTGNYTEVLDLNRNLLVLDDFTSLEASSPGADYRYSGHLSRFLAGPRILVYTLLLLLSVTFLLVLFHLGWYDIRLL